MRTNQRISTRHGKRHRLPACLLPPPVAPRPHVKNKTKRVKRAPVTRRFDLIGDRKMVPYCILGKFNSWSRHDFRKPKWDNTPERMFWRVAVRKGAYDLL